MKKIFCLAITVFVILDIVPAQTRDIIYAGTSSTRGSKGIYVFEFDRIQGKLIELQTVTEGSSPGFMALSPDKKMMYSIYGKGTLSD